jgi:hypothetical protein
MAILPYMKKSKPMAGEMVKTTLKLPRALWHAGRVRALEQRMDFQDLVALALTAYLKGSKEGAR